MILCESCSQNPATVHLTEISETERKERHLCEACAQKENIAVKHAFAASPQVLVEPKIHKVLKEFASLACPQCGLSYAEFRARGRLGCPNDYSFFQRALDPLLEKIHGRVEHAGKIPRRLAPSMEFDKEFKGLQAEMKRAVAAEEYEKAAELRDRIRELEGKKRGDR
ncbi:MAG: UvrB/UvrC motif-containing protein [Planctomycetes bacterium]|nr:UvrB/UvrC motif-containing protein [Planctomycetota bacterium]